MKFLITTIAYEPKTGGIETHSKLLAQALIDLGHEVTIVTDTASNQNENLPWKIYRKPSFYKLWRCYVEADLIIQNNFSIKLGWPIVLLNARSVIIHHTWLTDGTRRAKRLLSLKQWFCDFSIQFANSKAIADRVRDKSIVIGNPYDESIFYRREAIKGEKRIIIVGRLVCDKGIDIAIKALSIMHAEGFLIKMTIVGEGNEENHLREMVEEMGISKFVNFKGVLKGDELAETYAEHQICLIPSRWEEPFGIVALEALACGCRVVYSDGGGLREAVGEQGISFVKEDKIGCAEALKEAIQKSEYTIEEWQNVQGHLEKFKRDSYFKNLFRLIEGHCKIKL